MNHSSAYTKWFCRIALSGLSGLMIYVVTRPTYNYAHWIPHSLLKDMGVPYQAILWGETHGDMFLHFIGGAVLVWLTAYSAIPAIPGFRNQARGALFSVTVLCLGAEVFQFFIGRNVESSDLLLGITGSFMAYLAINKSKQ